MNQKFKLPLWAIIIVESIVVVIMLALGFKITYAPELANDWEAIAAVGTWICGFIVPFALLLFEKKLSASENKVSSSNLATLQELNEFKKKYEPLLNAFTEGEVIINGGNASDYTSSSIPSQNEIYRFICISMIATSQEIADHFEVNVEAIRHRIEDMWAVQEIISPATLSDDPNGNFKNCQWTKSK